jgi:hypothetical protein
MSSIEELAALQNARPNATEARETLTALFGLHEHGIEITGALLSGHGASARVAIDLSTGERMEFDSLREMANLSVLRAELVACTGALPALKREQAYQAVALVRGLASWEKTQTAADYAFDWGVSYLQEAKVLEAELQDQAQRWAAFEHLARCEPYTEGHRVFLSAASVVLMDATDGARWVRSSWFHSHVRQQDRLYSQAQVAARMAEVGWGRRGASGRIKATCPSRPQALGWAFFAVPAGWENRGSGSEVPTGVVRTTRANDNVASRVEVGTCRNLGTRGEA